MATSARALRAALSLLLLITAQLAGAAAQSGVDLAQLEKEALLAWKEQVEHGPSSVMASWQAELGHCANLTSAGWQGVKCKEGRVSKLDLGNEAEGNNGHTGPLMAELSTLRGLEILRMGENEFTGTLPPQWSTMSLLQTIQCAFNQLTGTLPPEWSAIRGLKRVVLPTMSLTGSIPAAWSALTALQYLNLGSNGLRGELLPQFSALQRLELLDLSVNELQGTLPPQWSMLMRLDTLDLAMNMLAGTVPREWQNMTTLRLLKLHNNEMRGELPQWTATMSKLGTIDLRHNHFSGTLPRAWANMIGLSVLDLAFNLLNGTLPAEYSRITGMRVMNVENNYLTGTLPAAWSTMKRLETLDLSYNTLRGGLPASWSSWLKVTHMTMLQNWLDSSLPREWSTLGTLTSLDLSDNFLVGSLPPIWSHMARIVDLRLKGNFFVGELPRQWSTMSIISELELSDNLLESELPPQWSTLVDMRAFGASNQFIRGPLPVQWSTMNNLLAFDVGYNRLTGFIRKEWSTMDLLQSFIAPGNGLTGTIPDQVSTMNQLITVRLDNNYLWGKLGKIAYIQLSQMHLHGNFFSGNLPVIWSNNQKLADLRLDTNNLSGTIPREWSCMSALQSLRMGSNSLSGTLPAELSKLSKLQSLSLDYNKHTGTLPKAWSALSSLSDLNMRGSGITGALPSEYSSWRQEGKLMQGLYFDHNKLTGTLPHVWSVLEPKFLDLDHTQLQCPNDEVLPSTLAIAIENSMRRDETGDIDSPNWKDVLCPAWETWTLSNLGIICLSVVGAVIGGMVAAVGGVMAYHRCTCRDPQCAHRHPGMLHSFGGHFLPDHSLPDCKWCLCKQGQPDMSVNFRHEVKPLLKPDAVIGVGAYGQVYRALWRGHDVAIKVILNGVNDDAINSFKVEVEASTRFTGCDKFVRLLGACMVKPDMCLISEYVPGGSLQELLEANPEGLPMQTALGYGMDIAEALSHMHPEYVHRDLKPDNILLTADHSSVKLIDFGMGRIVDNPLVDKTMTEGAGTPTYMAPEQFEGHITPKTDIYALGLILNQCLSGVAPFATLNNTQIMYAVLMKQQRPDIADNCPELLRMMLQRCWDENHKLRPAAVEVTHMLGFLLASLVEHGDGYGDDCSPGAEDRESDEPTAPFVYALNSMLGGTHSRIPRDHVEVHLPSLSDVTELTEHNSTSKLPSLPSIEGIPSILEAVRSVPTVQSHGPRPKRNVRPRRRAQIELPGDSLAGHLSAMLSRPTVPLMDTHPEETAQGGAHSPHAGGHPKPPTANDHHAANGPAGDDPLIIEKDHPDSD
eukprot:jgi/Tetstr1/457202/TSEL_043850.t1